MEWNWKHTAGSSKSSPNATGTLADTLTIPQNLKGKSAESV